MAEPVAAATYFAKVLGREVPIGSVVVVHDFGAGTFDASVVARKADGFEVLAVDGRDDTGGLDVDAAIIAHLETTYADRDRAAWTRLENPSTAEERRAKRQLWDDVRVAKERLSRSPSADLMLPLLDLDVHLTRAELEQLATPILEQTVRVTQGVMRWANLPEGQVAGVFLVGGSSRMPLMATLLHRALGEAPEVIEQPELVVAEGSILAGEALLASAPPAPGPATSQMRLGDLSGGSRPVSPAVPPVTSAPPVPAAGSLPPGSTRMLPPTSCRRTPRPVACRRQLAPRREARPPGSFATGGRGHARADRRAGDRAGRTAAFRPPARTGAAAVRDQAPPALRGADRAAHLPADRPDRRLRGAEPALLATEPALPAAERAVLAAQPALLAATGTAALPGHEPAEVLAAAPTGAGAPTAACRAAQPAAHATPGADPPASGVRRARDPSPGDHRAAHRRAGRCRHLRLRHRPRPASRRGRAGHRQLDPGANRVGVTGR
ncbi:Hsp70 family protein [Phytohabitans flavus]|uniref:Hsp70 family protein n=1 Tax=Phytohabitans flavus TaxID=1076124 RepID=UPI00363ADD3B